MCRNKFASCENLQPCEISKPCEIAKVLCFQSAADLFSVSDLQLRVELGFSMVELIQKLWHDWLVKTTKLAISFDY